MITITNIRAFEVDESTGIITNNLVYERKGLSRQVNNIKQLKRFRHLLARYIKLNNKTEVEFLFEYKGRTEVIKHDLPFALLNFLKKGCKKTLNMQVAL